MPTIDIDSDAAHEAAQRELQKPIYPKPSLTERLIEWINELMYRLAGAGASLPGGWFTLTILVILLRGRHRRHDPDRPTHHADQPW